MTAASESTKHTPGPWTYSDSDCTHGGYGACTEGCRVAGIWSPSREAEGAVFVTNPLYIRDRALIAAAPLLLEAAEAVLAYFGVLDGDPPPLHGLQDAITAARGEGSAQ